MKKDLYDIVTDNLKKNIPVITTVRPASQHVDIELCNDLQRTPEYNFLLQEFEKWFYEEGSDLIEYANANSFTFSFSIKESDLLCNISFVETNDTSFHSYFDHELEEILSDGLRETMIKELKIPRENFDEDCFTAEIVYDGGFSVLEFYYEGRKILLNSQDLKTIMKEIEEIFSTWETSGLTDPSDLKVLIERGGSFVIEKPVFKSCVIEIS